MDQQKYFDTRAVISRCLFQKRETKHQRNTAIPAGNTGGEFELPRLEFSSISYEWLVVNQDVTKAQFKGSGMVNGALDRNGNPYQFMLCPSDRTGLNGRDIFRIKIWWEGVNGEENVVYDNGAAQVIGSGSIVVHLGNCQGRGQAYVNRNS